MNRILISALLATVAMPMVAFAQTDETAPSATEEPAMETEGTAEPTQDDPAADEEAAPDDGAAAEEDATTDAPATGTGDEPTDDAMGTGDEPADDAAGATEEPADTETSADPAASGDDTQALAGEDDVEGPFVTVPLSGAWRVTDLEGKSVEDANGESIGDISDVLVNEQGEVIAVLVGVGGFLGIGEKDVAVAMSALQFGPGKTEGLRTEEEAAAEQAATGDMAGGTTGGMTTTTAPATTTPAPEEPVVGEDNLPNRIVLNVTREELEAAPAYEDVEEGTAGQAVAPAEEGAPGAGD